MESLFERELTMKFQLDKKVRVLIFNEPGEPFVKSLEKVGKRVMDIMKKHDFYSYAGSDEQVISNVQYDEEWGWVYSVRMQKTAD